MKQLTTRRNALQSMLAVTAVPSLALLGCGGGASNPTALPSNTPASYDFSALKQAALDVAYLKKDQTEAAGLPDEALALLADITTLENAALTPPITPEKAIGFYPQPARLTGNPHLDALYVWADTQLKTTAKVYKKATTGAAVFPNGSYNETRGLVGTAERLIWLVLSPVSERRYNPELFKRLLLLAYATSDDYLLNGGSIPDNNGLDDWFAAPGASYSWRILDECLAGFIPGLLLERLRQAADKMGKVFYDRSINEMRAQAPYATYCNRDISFAEVMMHTGMHRSNNLWIERAQLVTDLMIGPTVLYADGGYAYIGNQNESANYHGGTTTSLGNLYAVTGNPAILSALSKVANYELMTVEQGFVNEFYTVPAWKTAWNTGDGVSHSFMSYISQSAHWQTFADVRSRVIATSSNVLDSAFYTERIAGKPLADNYLVYDRNIQGPRYRKNHFSYAMTTRKVSLPSNLGALTLVGAMTTQADPSAGTNGSSRRHLSDALMSVHAKVHTHAGTATEWDTWSYLIGNTNPQTTMSRTIGAISTPCTLYRQTSGPTGHVSNWQSFQQWLALPDRLIGLVEVYPKDGKAQNAYKIDGRIKLGYGRSGTRYKKTLQAVKEGEEYLYGNLRVLIHAHDFTTVDTAMAGVIRDSPLDATEIRFRYVKPGTDGTSNVSHPGDTRKFFLVEIREKSVTTPIAVARHDAAGVKGIIVSDVDNNRYGVFRNLNASAVQVNVSDHLQANVRSTVHHARGDEGLSAQPTQLSGTVLSIPANQQQLLITSTQANDHEPCWAHYDELLSELPALTILTEGAQTVSCTPEANRFVALTQNTGLGTTLQWTVNDVAVAGASEAQFSPSSSTKGQRINCLMSTTLANGTPYSLKSNTVVTNC
ncbi:MAG: hypothetical protein RL297_1720 [Pseudomonadota bacterium]|jgi:hypothetical protein